jgi:hypothetical protein
MPPSLRCETSSPRRRSSLRPRVTSHAWQRGRSGPRLDQGPRKRSELLRNCGGPQPGGEGHVGEARPQPTDPCRRVHQIRSNFLGSGRSPSAAAVFVLVFRTRSRYAFTYHWRVHGAAWARARSSEAQPLVGTRRPLQTEIVGVLSVTIVQHGCDLEALPSDRRFRERKPSLQNPRPVFIAEVPETKLSHPNMKKSHPDGIPALNPWSIVTNLVIMRWTIPGEESFAAPQYE